MERCVEWWLPPNSQQNMNRLSTTAPMEDDWLTGDRDRASHNKLHFSSFLQNYFGSAECRVLLTTQSNDLRALYGSHWSYEILLADVRFSQATQKPRVNKQFCARVCVCVWLMVASVLLFWPRARREMGGGGGGVVGRRIVPYHAGIVLYHVAAVKCEAINIEIANTLETDTRTHMKKRAASSSRGELRRSKLRTFCTWVLECQ